MVIVRGTTPTIEYSFSTIEIAEIGKAVLTIKQLDEIVIERDLESSEVIDDKLTWSLTQEESLRLHPKVQATLYLDYVLANGRRASAKTKVIEVANTGQNEVIA